MTTFDLPYKDEWMVDKERNRGQPTCIPTSMEDVEA
jgi:hypothetical protein